MTRLSRRLMGLVVAGTLAGALECPGGLLIHWAFNELSGGTAVDSSPTGADGAYQGGHTKGVLSVEPGLYATAVRFNGTDGEVFKAGFPALNTLTQEFTVAAWINPDGVAGVQRIFSSNSSTNGWSFGLKDDGFRFTTISVEDYDLPASLSPGTWTHVALTFFTNGAGVYTAEFFVDGASVGQVAGTRAAIANTEDAFAASTGSGEYFGGVLDEVRVYDSVQTTGSIAQLAAKEAFIHWALNETSGTTARDATSTGADGTYQGGYTLGIESASPSIYASAVRFNGSNGEVFKSGFSELNNLTEDFTVSAWINPDTLSGVQRIFSSASDGWGFGLNGSSGLRFTTYGIKDYDIAVSIPTGKWTHVAVVFDATFDAEFFVNGKSVGTVNGSSAANAGSGNWFIASAGTGEYFDGGIDEVKLYGQAISSTGIAALSTVREDIPTVRAWVLALLIVLVCLTGARILRGESRRAT